MKGSVRKRGATWSYRVELGVVQGRRNQIREEVIELKKKPKKL